MDPSKISLTVGKDENREELLKLMLERFGDNPLNRLLPLPKEVKEEF